MKYFHTQRSVKLSLDAGNEFCHSVYHFFFVLSRVSSKTCHVSSSANYCIQTADLWFWKQLLCQLSPNNHHLHFFGKEFKMISRKRLSMIQIAFGLGNRTCKWPFSFRSRSSGTRRKATSRSTISTSTTCPRRRLRGRNNICD